MVATFSFSSSLFKYIHSFERNEGAAVDESSNTSRRLDSCCGGKSITCLSKTVFRPIPYLVPSGLPATTAIQFEPPFFSVLRAVPLLKLAP